MTINDLTAYNITIIRQNTATFFGQAALSLPPHHPHLLNSLTANEVADEESYQIACKWVSPWILLQMKNLLFGLYRQRNSRIRKEIPLFICGEWKHTSMTDVCVIDENGSLSSLLPKRCCSVQQSFRKFSWCGSPRRQSDGRNHDDWHIPNIFQDSCHLGTDRSGEYPTAPTVVAMPS